MGGFHLLQQPAPATVTATLALLLLAIAAAHSFAQNGNRELEPERTAVQWRELRAVGPGSSPPTCQSKCGNCSPCKPVHVPIRSGSSLPYEYYPKPGAASAATNSSCLRKLETHRPVRRKTKI